MWSLLNNINQSHDLLFVVIRSVLLFLLGIFILRYGARRYNLNTVFDYLLLMVVGSVISRGINGSATFVSTAVSVVALIFCHRLISIVTVSYPTLEKSLKGESRLIISNGRFNRKKLKHLHLTEHDILEEMRKQLHHDNLKVIKKGFLEPNGYITFIVENQ